MAFHDLEIKRIQNAADAFMAARRPPAHIRKALDYDYTLHNQTIELLEVRPRWDNPAEIMKRPFAKATYVKASNQWRVYWMRGNLKWHPYEPPVASSIQAFFELVNLDAHSCFFG